jgi:hypothetical protein
VATIPLAKKRIHQPAQPACHEGQNERHEGVAPNSFDREVEAAEQEAPHEGVVGRLNVSVLRILKPQRLDPNPDIDMNRSRCLLAARNTSSCSPFWQDGLQAPPIHP